MINVITTYFLKDDLEGLTIYFITEASLDIYIKKC